MPNDGVSRPLSEANGKGQERGVTRPFFLLSADKPYPQISLILLPASGEKDDRTIVNSRITFVSLSVNGKGDHEEKVWKSVYHLMF
jgi:hypothetical protein